MKKKVISLVLAFVLIIGLVGCGNTTEPEPVEPTENGTEEEVTEVKTETLKLAFNQDETHPQYIAMKQFGDTLFEKTNGAYAIEIYPSELLGAQKETLEMVQSGTIAMSMVANSLLENWNADFVVFNLPYVFVSVDHQKAIVNDPEVVGDLYNSIEDQGIKVLAAFHGGVRNVYTSKAPITSPSDLQGDQIRVMQSDTNLKMMDMMGGTGIAMGQGDVYTAIQTGVLDGAENNELIFDRLLQYEVAPYYNYTKHLMIPDVLTISTTVWNELPEDVKQVFNEELPNAVDLEYDIFDTAVKESLANVKEKGAIITELDITSFMEAVAPLTESKLTTDTTKEIYNQIKAVESEYK